MSKSFLHLVQAMSAHVRDPSAGSGIPELVAVRLQECQRPLQGQRLNLVIPVVLGKWSYGGVATALRLFEKMRAEFEYARIVLLNQKEADFEFSEWPGWDVDRGEPVQQSIAFLDDETPLHLCDGDCFLATFWTTAVYVRQVMIRQLQLFPQANRRFVYLVQDYEPGFYPWSYRYSCTKSTYSDRDGTIAIFNSQLLADHFARRGFQFAEQYVYEPILHPVLRKKLSAGRQVSKERLILAYGRPSVPRNAFELVVDSLRIWARTLPNSAQWRVVSAGEEHNDIPLGEGVTLQSLGKLTVDEYAHYLMRCWAGVSFMISPHPSYPPLEMAEFGAWVITNNYESKDLSTWAPNIIGVGDLTPDVVAEKLVWCCNQYEPEPVGLPVGNSKPVFRGGQSEFPFLSALVTSWRRARSTGNPDLQLSVVQPTQGCAPVQRV